MLLGGENARPLVGSQERGEFPRELAWLLTGSLGRAGRGVGVSKSVSGPSTSISLKLRDWLRCLAAFSQVLFGFGFWLGPAAISSVWKLGLVWRPLARLSFSRLAVACLACSRSSPKTGGVGLAMLWRLGEWSSKGTLLSVRCIAVESPSSRVDLSGNRLPPRGRWPLLARLWPGLRPISNPTVLNSSSSFSQAP